MPPMEELRESTPASDAVLVARDVTRTYRTGAHPPGGGAAHLRLTPRPGGRPRGAHNPQGRCLFSPMPAAAGGEECRGDVGRRIARRPAIP